MDKIESKTKYFKKYDIDYLKCKNKTKEYLDKAIDYVQKTEEKFNNSIEIAFKAEINVSSFCEKIGISRMAIYKKDQSGSRNNESILKYLNAKNNELRTLKKLKINEFLRESSIDYKLLTQLLNEQVKFIEQEETIKRLESENKELRSLLRDSNLISNNQKY